MCQRCKNCLFVDDCHKEEVNMICVRCGTTKDVRFGCMKNPHCESCYDKKELEKQTQLEYYLGIILAIFSILFILASGVLWFMWVLGYDR
jgi:uncharacterized paraquat-inducible protein A